MRRAGPTDVFNVRVTYDGATLGVTITDAGNPSQTFSASWPLDIPSVVGSNLAYAGFTGGTGALTAIQDILTWNYVSSAGPPPVATVKPTSMGFGQIYLGATSPVHTVTLTNSNASKTLLITSIIASGNFSQTNNCPSALAANSGCTIAVRFTPSMSGTISGVLSVYDSASNSPQMVALSGQGSLPLTVTPASLNFSPVAVGTSSTALTVTLQNQTSYALNLSYNSSAGFAATPASSNGCGPSLALRSSCNLAVTFTPLQNGNIWGSLVISGAAFPARSVNLTGTGSGTPASLSFSPSSLNFGNQAISVNSAPRTVTVSNKGASAVNLNSLIASPSYSVTPNGTSPCGGLLAAGGKCTFAATFTPGTVGTSKGSVAIANSGPVSPLIYDLSGIGIQPVTFSVTGLTFAAQTVGTASASQTITLTNNQGIPLNLMGITASGDYTASPGGTTPCGSSVPANSKCSLQVAFTPTQTGTVKGVVTITHDAAGSPQNVGLTGTGQ